MHNARKIMTREEDHMNYVELQVTTNFSFLRGASHPEELVEQAADEGYTALAITDRNSVAGIVRAHMAAKKRGIRIIPACRLDLADGPSLLAYPTNCKAYSRLTNLLTLGNRRTEKGESELYTADVYAHGEGVLFIAIPPQDLSASLEIDAGFVKKLQAYKHTWGASLYLAATRHYNGNDEKYLHRLAELSARLQIPLVATNDVHYHCASRRQLQDIVTCIREKCTIYDAGFRLHPNAERYLKPEQEMIRVFRKYPQLIERTGEIVSACRFSLDELQYQYPREITSPGCTPQQELTRLVWEGAHNIYGAAIPDKVSSAIRYELSFIDEMNYAAYFLTVYDIVRFARQQRILCQGRGSAANSTVCYCLGITSVDPSKFDLLFERFISSARNEPPDIDVDFEHERREEVMQYIYQKYGRERAAVVATVTQQHEKGALRDVGKAMGLSVDTINRLSGAIRTVGQAPFEERIATSTEKRIVAEGLNLADPHLRKTLQLTREFMGFPRQLGQHSGGFVITEGKLSDLCPIHNARMEGRTCIEWNKDDIDALGFLKIDVLALGMLTCIRKAFDLIILHYNREYTLASVPQDDPKVYQMISEADTIGVFQIESRAQQSMLPRLKPQTFYDLVIEVAIVRPGPIQGDMVHPYLRRRNNLEKVEYPSEELKKILERTKGVPLFQEQAMKIAIVAAGFTAAEADELRRSMGTFKAQGKVAHFRDKLIRGMTERGYEKEYAERVFKQLEGFGSYGFPESHAASFALLVYISSWIKCHYPDVFACALLNSMPMGFYQPAQIISDAWNHQVEVRPVDINYSDWDNTLEKTAGGRCALRLGFRQVKGLREEEIKTRITDRKRSWITLAEIYATGLTAKTMEKLADADAFRSIGLDRRQALWEISIRDRPTALFSGQQPESDDAKITLPEMLLSEHVVHDYAATSLSLKAHPVSFLREKLHRLHITPSADLASLQNGDPVKVAGLVLVKQRPGTANGICFMTIEDETGTANLVIFQDLLEKYRKEVLHSRLIMVEGKLQVEGKVIHVVAARCQDFSGLLRHLTPAKVMIRKEFSQSQSQLPFEEKIIPKPRSFR